MAAWTPAGHGDNMVTLARSLGEITQTLSNINLYVAGLLDQNVPGRVSDTLEREGMPHEQAAAFGSKTHVQIRKTIESFSGGSPEVELDVLVSIIDHAIEEVRSLRETRPKGLRVD